MLVLKSILGPKYSIQSQISPREEKFLNTSRSPLREVHISSLLIDNAVEAEIEVKLLLGSRVGQDYALSGSINASSCDYRGKRVTLFSDQRLGVHSRFWTPLQLEVQILCLPCRAASEVVMDLALAVTKPSEENFLKEVLFTGLKFSTENEYKFMMVGDFKFVFHVRMSPKPRV